MILKRKHLQAFVAGIGFLVLIFDSRLAVEGARAGLDLCIRTVIPSLFPFFVLSGMLNGALGGTSSRLLQRIAGFFGIPSAGASVLIPAVLGGYPVGAKAVGDLYYQKRISRKEAERMLAFCSNTGPSFLFGMVSGFFPESRYIWVLWLIHLASAGLTALTIPGKTAEKSDSVPISGEANGNILSGAARAMGMVCCWVLLFRMILTFLENWLLWMLRVWVQVALSGFLELTNGCCGLALIPDSDLRFVLCSCMLAFGGICVLLQTASVTSGLSLLPYCKGKLHQTLYSFLLSCAMVSGKLTPWAAVTVTLAIIFRKIQNRYRNPEILPV